MKSSKKTQSTAANSLWYLKTELHHVARMCSAIVDVSHWQSKNSNYPDNIK